MEKGFDKGREEREKRGWEKGEPNRVGERGKERREEGIRSKDDQQL